MATLGCDSVPGTTHNSVTVQGVALQPGDVTQLQKCAESGPITAVLREQKAKDPPAFRQNDLEWTWWRNHGAVDAYFAVYGRSVQDCMALTGSGSGAPLGGLMAGLVVSFKNEMDAARIYRADSTLFGLGPRDLTFIKVAGGSLSTGADTGLGQQSSVGSALVAGTSYYIAFWHKSRFNSYVIAYDVDSGVAERAVMNVNKRMSTVL